MPPYYAAWTTPGKEFTSSPNYHKKFLLITWCGFYGHNYVRRSMSGQTSSTNSPSRLISYFNLVFYQSHVYSTTCLQSWTWTTLNIAISVTDSICLVQSVTREIFGHWDPSVCKSNRLHVEILRFSFITLRYILQIPIKWSVIILQSWTSTGYSSYSTGSSVTNCQFTLIM